MKAWFFSDADKRLANGDGREIALGVTHKVKGKIVPCKNGLHGSAKLIDALCYAPGPVLWEVELGGTVVEHEDGDKYAARERTYLRGGIDISDTLREFARWCALQVIDKWDAPSIARQYLETGDESIRAAARAAARDAAWDAAWDAQNAKLTEMVEAVFAKEGA